MRQWQSIDHRPVMNSKLNFTTINTVQARFAAATVAVGVQELPLASQHKLVRSVVIREILLVGTASNSRA